MASGFKWWDLLHNEFLTHNTHISAGIAGASVLVAGGAIYAIGAPRLALKTASDEAFIPSPQMSIRNVWEVIGEFVQSTARDIVGPHYKEYFPILLFIFVWTLLSNLLGSVPGFASATDNINTSLAMGLTVFLYYNYKGFKAHGFHYLEQFTGHLHGLLLLLLGPVMFVIETISHMIRPLTLGIRLRTNIYADHQVHGTIVGILSEAAQSLSEKFGAVGHVLGFTIEAIAPVPILLLGLLVCVIQAFVFTLLTMIYIGLATAHEEH